MIGRPELAHDPAYGTTEARLARLAEIEAHIEGVEPGTHQVGGG